MLMDAEQLIKKAILAREKAYAPYSNFLVGAALLTRDGRVFTGCNIENAAYSPTNCAERTAFFKAVSEGAREFSAIAIVGGLRQENALSHTYPCGVCRQVMMEFCSPDFKIYAAVNENEYSEHTLKELLPNGFGPGSLKPTG